MSKEVTGNEYVLLQGDCLEQLKQIPDDSLDSLVTDPPAGISFMGKEWDSDKGGRDGWIKWMTEVMTEVKRVLKPGAHGLVWAIPRTSHWTATALEDAGFEVRDVVTHLFGSGFPKSLDVSKAIDKAAGAEREVISESGSDDAKQWQGWGTALKPASEHWILVRKPCSEKTVAANVIKHGTGGINIDASRIGTETIMVRQVIPNKNAHHGYDGSGSAKSNGVTTQHQGRFPANLVLTEGEATEALDAQSEVREGASRFFYCAKISSSERGEGNSHPTVKPKKLMSYLIRMITPPGGIVLDPFMGSGSTGIAAIECEFNFIGIEKENEYFEIASKRIEGVKAK